MSDELTELDEAARVNLRPAFMSAYTARKAELLRDYPDDLEFVAMSLRGWIWDQIEAEAEEG